MKGIKITSARYTEAAVQVSPSVMTGQLI